MQTPYCFYHRSLLGQDAEDQSLGLIFRQTSEFLDFLCLGESVCEDLDSLELSNYSL